MMRIAGRYEPTSPAADHMPTTDERGETMGNVGFDCLVRRKHVPNDLFPYPQGRTRFKVRVKHETPLLHCEADIR